MRPSRGSVGRGGQQARRIGIAHAAVGAGAPDSSTWSNSAKPTGLVSMRRSTGGPSRAGRGGAGWRVRPVARRCAAGVPSGGTPAGRTARCSRSARAAARSAGPTRAGPASCAPVSRCRQACTVASCSWQGRARAGNPVKALAGALRQRLQLGSRRRAASGRCAARPWSAALHGSNRASAALLSQAQAALIFAAIGQRRGRSR